MTHDSRQEDQTGRAERVDSGADKSCTGPGHSASLPDQTEAAAISREEMRQLVRELLTEELAASQKDSKGEASDQETSGEETSAQETSAQETSAQETSDQENSGLQEEQDEPLVLLKHGKPTRFEQIPQSLREIAVEIFACILIAIGIYSFAKHANLAPGGVVGLALIVNHLFPLFPSVLPAS